MCDTLPDIIYDTPVSQFRDRLPDWLANDALQADVLDAVMQVMAASEDEADVKRILAACREHCTPQPSLTQRLLSAMSECSNAAHKCLIIEQLPHFCTSTAAEVSAAIAACRSEYSAQPALRLPIIAALAAMHIPYTCMPQLVAYINDALASASPADYPTLLRSALRCLPLFSILPLLHIMRRLSLTIDCDTAAQLLHTLVDARAVSGHKVMAWVAAVKGSRGELGVMDVLVMLALLTGGEEEEEEAVWQCMCRCVADKRLTLRRLRDVLSRPWLDVLSSYVPALSALCRRLVSSSDSVLREWARQLLPGVFSSLPASQVEMRRVLLSGCSKSYQAEPNNVGTGKGAVSEDTEERRFLFNRAELCADIFLCIAHTAPLALTAHLSYLDSVMDFPDALDPLVLHRLAYTIALTIAASPTATSHTNRLCNELTKLLTMGNTAARKTALIMTAHLVRAVSLRRAAGGGGECDWLDGLMRRSVAVLTSSVRAVVDAVSGAAVGVAMMDWSHGSELMTDGVYVLDGLWNVCCVALDGICSRAAHLPTAVLESVASTIKQAITRLAIVSFDVPISTPSRPCVLFAHQLPNSLLCHLPDAPSSAPAAASPNVRVHSFYRTVTRGSKQLSPLRLFFLPLLFRAHLTCLAASADVESGSDKLTAFLQCAYELPAAAASGDTLPADAPLLLDVGLCAVISYHCCLTSIEVACGSSPSPVLTRPLLTAFSTLLHLLDLVLECDKQLRAREQDWREQEHADGSSTPAWLTTAHLLHDSVSALPMPDAVLLTTVLHFCLSSPALPSDVAIPPSSITTSPSSPLSFSQSSSSSSLLRHLYQSAYRPAASAATAGLFTDTAFFSLLHIALRSIQLLLRQHRADAFISHSSSIFLPAHTAVRDVVYTAHVSSHPPSTSSASCECDFSHPFSSSSASSSTSSSSSTPVPRPWPLLSPAVSSLVSRCAASGRPVHPLEVLLLRTGCGAALLASLDELCSLEQENRTEPYIAPPSTTKRAKKRSVNSSSPPAAAPAPTPVPVPASREPAVAPLNGKEEQEEDELVTPFERRRRGRRKQQQPTVDDHQPAPSNVPLMLEQGPAVAVSFVLPDQSSQLMVADSLSLLSTLVCHVLGIALTYCQERQALDEREWPVTWQALAAVMFRATRPSSAYPSSSSSSSTTSPLRSLFKHVVALSSRHTCSSTSLAGWSFAHVLHQQDGSLPLPSGLVQQMTSVYPHNQLLATCVALRLLPLLTSCTTPSPSPSPSSLFLSNLSIRLPQPLKLFDGAVRALVTHCTRHMSQPAAAAAAGPVDGWSELTTPLQSSKLAGGLHGDDWTLHWLFWRYTETADSSHVERVVEWVLQCMYELLGGQQDDREAEDEVDELKHNVPLSGHSVLATLTAGSFASYFQLLLHLAQLQLVKLQPPATARPSAYSFAAAFHRPLLAYCHLLQVYLLAADIPVPPQRLRLSSKQPHPSTPSSTKHLKRSRPPPAHLQCRPFSASDPSCNTSSAGLSAVHSAVLSSFVLVTRQLLCLVRAAVSSHVLPAAASGALHSAEQLSCVDLVLYATEQAELINANAPVVALAARSGRGRKGGTASDAASAPSSTSLQLLRAVELLRATVDALLTPYNYTLQSSPEPTANNHSATTDSFSHSPLPPLPHHTLTQLTDTKRAMDAASASAEEEEGDEEEDEDDDEYDDDEEDEEEDEWSDEEESSDEADAGGGFQRGISRFHQRMDEPQGTATARQAAQRKQPNATHRHQSRNALFDSTDEDEDEEYVEEEETAMVGLEQTNGKEEKRTQQVAVARSQMVDDDDVESGKDEV